MRLQARVSPVPANGFSFSDAYANRGPYPVSLSPAYLVSVARSAGILAISGRRALERELGPEIVRPPRPRRHAASSAAPARTRGVSTRCSVRNHLNLVLVDHIARKSRPRPECPLPGGSRACLRFGAFHFGRDSANSGSVDRAPFLAISSPCPHLGVNSRGFTTDAGAQGAGFLAASLPRHDQ